MHVQAVVYRLTCEGLVRRGGTWAPNPAPPGTNSSPRHKQEEDPPSPATRKDDGPPTSRSARVRKQPDRRQLLTEQEPTLDHQGRPYRQQHVPARLGQPPPPRP